MENILLEDFLLLENEDDVSAERDDLKQLLQEANLKVRKLKTSTQDLPPPDLMYRFVKDVNQN